MKTNTTEITEEKNRAGEYCGACHDGVIAFGHTDDTCIKCHNGDIGAMDYLFSELQEFPKTRYGNRINWVKALKQRLISPKQSLFDENFTPIRFGKDLRLDPEWNLVKTRAIFPHQKHVAWLDCAQCHPDIFNIQKKGTEELRMDAMVEGKFCGVCHLTVAFPLQDCKRCHPDLK